MGRPELMDDERFATRDQRVRHASELHDLVAAWSQGRPRAEAVAALVAQGAPAAEVLEPADALRNPDVLRREEVVELDHPQHGSTGLMGPGVPIRFSHADVRLDTPAPHLGEHTEELLATIGGLSAQEIAELRQAGVV
jgi:crotonobetainyl-CoA:carnitine CoA-transferase CaiB-like acyl-CoA transferase